MNKGNCIRVSSDGKIDVFKIPWKYKEFCKLLDSDGIEVVKTQILREFFSDCVYGSFQIAMIVDDCGMVKGSPVNDVASYMYGQHLHGGKIYGDVLFVVLDSHSGIDYPLTNCAKCFYRLKKFFNLL